MSSQEFKYSYNLPAHTALYLQQDLTMRKEIVNKLDEHLRCMFTKGTQKKCDSSYLTNTGMKRTPEGA